MLLWHAAVLGVVEGLTEFLPVSSTGHLLLVGDLLGLRDGFTKTFDVAIQGGALLAVLAVTWREWLRPAVWTRVLAGFLPTAVIGFALYKFVKTVLLAHPLTVAVALVAGGVAIVAFERWLKRRPVPADGGGVETVSHGQAACIGLAQALAVVPGVSRSAATIVSGLALGLPRPTVVAYSFLLAVPTIASAAAYDLWKERAALTPGNLGLLAVGFAVSALVAFAVVRWLLDYVRKHDFTWFGAYRIVAGLIVGWWLLR